MRVAERRRLRSSVAPPTEILWTKNCAVLNSGLWTQRVKKFTVQLRSTNMKLEASSINLTPPIHVATARRGAASIVAIAVLVILAGIMAQQVRRVLMERRQMRNEVAYLQTEKLAEAGIMLAQKSKSKDPAWMGLTWNLPPGSIHQTNSAEVVITVNGDSCSVIARYPVNAEIPFQVTRTRKLAP